MSHRVRTCSSLVAILLIALALRAVLLQQNRFHPDEAWYAHFALLITSGSDPWLSTVVVDKPPLPFYLTAGSLSLIGSSPRSNPALAEFAARLPSLAAGVVGVALVYQFGRKLYGSSVGRLAALALALSPLAILFSITLFTDTLLTAFLLWSLWSAARGRWGWCGVAFALAFASKQAALLFAPLIWAIAVTGEWQRTRRCSTAHVFAGFGRWLLPVAAGLGMVFLWDILRRPEIGFWAQGYSDNNPQRFIRSSELPIRFRELVRLVHFTTASTTLNLLLAAACVGLALDALLRRRRTMHALFDLLLMAFVVGYLALYWLLAFNLWDRYFVALAPLLAILLARALSVISKQLSVISEQSPPTVHCPLFTVHRPLFTVHCSLFTVQCPLFTVHCPLFTVHCPPFTVHRSPFTVHCSLFTVYFLLLLLPALRAARSGYPVGGDHGAYDGLEQAAAYLYEVNEGAVLYDYWLSWEFSFYLFDGPLYLAWVPGPQALARDLQAHGRNGERYFVVPAWESFFEMEQAVHAAGFEAQERLTTFRRDGTKSFTVYQIVPRDQVDAMAVHDPA